jgi:hypothetical protein
VLARHLLRLLTLVALLVAPLGMLGGHAAMAAPKASAESGHCSELGGMEHEAPDESPPAKSIDCAMVCSCVPPAAAPLDEPPSLLQPPTAARHRTLALGPNPEADPPPPRLS